MKHGIVTLLLLVLFISSCGGGQDDIEISDGQIQLDLYIRVEDAQVYATVSNPNDWMWHSEGKGKFSINGSAVDGYDIAYDYYYLSGFSYERGAAVRVECSYDDFSTVTLESSIPGVIDAGFDPGISPVPVSGVVNTETSYSVIPVNPGIEDKYKITVQNYGPDASVPDSGYGWYGRDQVHINESQLTLTDGTLADYLDIEIVPMNTIRDNSIYQTVDLHICGLDKVESTNRP